MSEALRLAEWVESDMTCEGDAEIVAELRRLHSLNAELVEALRHCMKVMQEEADAYLAWNSDTNATLLAEIAALKEYLNDKG
jgi:hypothetical protein